MKVLHICNDFCGSKVHSNLAKALDEVGIEQTVYCPVREERLLGINQFNGKHIRFFYSYCIKSWYKYVYQFKREMLYRDMKRKIDLSQFDVIHAPTLFSDGGLALKAYKEFGIPYIVSVRNTDINLYIRKLRHTHYIGREILINASKIVFISKGEKTEFDNSDFVKPIYEYILNKTVIQPNGIEDYWLQNISHHKRAGHNVLFIGDYTMNKNVSRLATAVLQLRKIKGYEDVKLTLVGGLKVEKTEKNDDRILRLVDENPCILTDMGRIYDKEQLTEIMRSCSIFAMPSISETFGLVYIEALSQNLPVIYSKGQGIDGFFDESVGIGVNPKSVNEIHNAILHLFEKKDEYNNRNVDFASFNWNNIASKYIKLYTEANQKLFKK